MSLKKAEGNVPGVPAKPKLADEVKRGASLRLNERFDAKGGWARDTIARNLVDIWVARAGVVFATQALLGACAVKRRPNPSSPFPGAPPYMLRRDGQPWARLREHLAAASETDRAAAKVYAAEARKRTDELRQAVAYAFCDPVWVAEDLDGMFEHGYGQLALLTALPDAATARKALLRLLGEGPPDDEYPSKFQLIEEAVPHIPNLMLTLDDADAELIRKARARAWNGVTRKPWDELVECLGAGAPATKPAAKSKGESAKRK